MSKISRTVRGGKEVARNVRKGCRTLDDDDDDDDDDYNSIITYEKLGRDIELLRKTPFWLVVL
jgi:hypothetical protein